ncbi:WbqC family protein [Chitinophaga sp. XS-30]|uniref:WbqC family protein n=1 Tax=Chitinophaga sp. XS-30 TaxID=2604421 RepID=UPI0011DE185F|nr:WbqC family protein [Chitinophaga sp. XS-30]QEH41740.1 WbqC family protein [Chitinophaga sp. XS-30]
MTEQSKLSTLLIESQYFPPISFYKTLISVDILNIERYEHYQKVSYRNRCYVAGPNGVILLSVPLTKGKNQRTIMKDVRISNEEKWQALHWKTLTSAYRRSPWFEYFEEDLQALYARNFSFLLDWNMACLEWANKAVGMERPVSLTESFRKTYDPASGVLDQRDVMIPGKSQADLPQYTQVFGERTGFMPDLSILDLLFCEGKRALELLK